MKEKYRSTKGFSVLIVIGSWGGFHATKDSQAYHICIGFIAFTLFLYDVENALARSLKRSNTINKKDKI